MKNLRMILTSEGLHKRSGSILRVGKNVKKILSEAIVSAKFEVAKEMANASEEEDVGSLTQLYDTLRDLDKTIGRLIAS